MAEKAQEYFEKMDEILGEDGDEEDYNDLETHYFWYQGNYQEFVICVPFVGSHSFASSSESNLSRTTITDCYS